MITISLCMIVKNEEEVLARCLDSVRGIADEIIICDTGSTDQTKEIAARYTDLVYEEPWQEDFAAARNAAFLRASKEDWFWLDADDVLEEEERQKLLALKKRLSPGEVGTVMMRYATAFDDNGQASFVFERERLIRNVGRPVWQGRVHEVIVPFAPILHSDIMISHRKVKISEPGRNLRIYEKMEKQGAVFSPRELFYYARELMENGNLEKAVDVFYRFLKDETAFLPNRQEACCFLAKCLQALSRPVQAREVLWQGLALGTPTGELCCALAESYMKKEQWKEAAFWYRAALQAEPDLFTGGFIRQECYGYLPAIELCVCYDRLGDWQRAAQWNEKAAVYQPSSPAVAYNRNYFAAKQKADGSKKE